MKALEHQLCDVCNCRQGAELRTFCSTIGHSFWGCQVSLSSLVRVAQAKAAHMIRDELLAGGAADSKNNKLKSGTNQCWITSCNELLLSLLLIMRTHRIVLIVRSNVQVYISNVVVYMNVRSRNAMSSYYIETKLDEMNIDLMLF